MKTPTPIIDVIEDNVRWRDTNDSDIQPVVQLAQKIGVNLLLKGKVDIITDGKVATAVGTPGSGKRVGGQGDVLAGVIASSLYQAGKNGFGVVNALTCASLIVRKSANLAFAKKHWGLTCPDIIKCLPKALGEVIGRNNI